MRFRFDRSKIEVLFTEEKNAHRYPPEIVDAFFEAMTAIMSAKDTRDLRALKSFHFEKLKGKRKDEFSLRLNDQWRLTFWILSDEQGECLLINDIEDYH